MPLVGISWIIIDLLRRTESRSTVGAARKHHVGRAAPGREHAGQHVNVIVSSPTGAVNRQKQHSGESVWIDCPAKSEVAAQVDCGALVKSWCLSSVLRIARTLAEKGVAFSTDINITVRVYIKAPVHRPIGNNNRRLPGDAAVRGALKFHAATAAVNAVIYLVLKAVPRAAGFINSEPFLVAAAGAFLA